MAAEVGVNNWLRLVRSVLEQVENQRRKDENVYGMEQDEIWRLTLRMERMKRDGTWARPVVEEDPETGHAQKEGDIQNAEKEENHRDRRDAIDIFPEEIWRKILEQVSEPFDLFNCNSTCRLFEKLLRQWKSGRMLKQALPYIYRHLSKDEILRCRLVCRSWNKAIDNFFLNHPSLRPYQEEEGYYRRLDFVCPLKEKQLYQENVFVFCNDPTLDNSATLEDDRFKKKGENPFIGRYVQIKLGFQGFHINPTPDQPWDTWWGRFFQFLQAYGKEIWYLTLTFPNQPSQLVQEKLASFIGGSLFQSMPYLRKLTIDARGEEFEDRILREELPEAPYLDTLEVLNLKGMRNNNEFYSLVKKYGPQLGKLHINSGTLMRLMEINFSNLKELTLQVGEGRFPSVFNELYSLQQCKMENLSKVQLIFPIIPCYFLFEDLNSFLNALSAITKLSCLRLAGNLERLKFASDLELAARLNTMHYNSSPSTLRSVEIDVDWLKIQNGCDPVCFNFIQNCFPNLEYLSIFARETSPSLFCSQIDSGMEVDLLDQTSWEARRAFAWPIIRRVNEFVELHRYMYGRNVYESRVWALLTELKVLSVQWNVFTREEYEAFRRN